MLSKTMQITKIREKSDPIAAPSGQIDIRLKLQGELIRRCKANPKYSLRAFAKFLGIESSRLSKILRGERPVSLVLLDRLSQKLGLTPKEIASCRSNMRNKKRGISEEITQSSAFLQLSQDIFESIEDWKHYAVLELMKVRGFQSDLKYVAKALNIRLPEARAYAERLQRVGLLKINSDSSWTDLSDGFSSHILSETESSIAHRRSQKELLELAIEALESIPMERRDQSSMMMATHSSKIMEAKLKIKRFRRDLCEFLEDCEVKDAVYQLTVSLFPLIEAESKRTDN
jgi:uncharacterized protein (TIGR02147 family)